MSFNEGLTRDLRKGEHHVGGIFLFLTIFLPFEFFFIPGMTSGWNDPRIGIYRT